jgi:hypothetical protein
MTFSEIMAEYDQLLSTIQAARGARREITGFNTADRQLTRISHQAAWNTGKALVFWSEARMIKNTVCYSSMPITVQASLRVRKLALHSNLSYCYAFRSRVVLTNTNPAPAPVILVRNAG